MSDIANQIMPALSKSSSLRELYLGVNPWKEADWKNILSVYQKPSDLNILGLGVHTYLTEECVKVTYNSYLGLFRTSFRFQIVRRATTVNSELKIIFKGQIKDQPAEDANFKNILVDRLKALAMKPKKKKLRKDMG